MDSDKGTLEESTNTKRINELQADGIKAYATRKREPENYLHTDCFNDAPQIVCFTEVDDVKIIVNSIYGNIAKDNVLEHFWLRMNADQIRDVERFATDDGIEHYEFTEMFRDFLSLV